MAAFLTDDWFATVEKLTAEAGDLNLPPAQKDLFKKVLEQTA